jgi:uncharacterized protein
MIWTTTRKKRSRSSTKSIRPRLPATPFLPTAESRPIAVEVPLERQDAFLLVRRTLRDREAIRRCLAAEAIMEDLAARLGGAPGAWGLAGLLHDLDRHLTEQNPRRRGAVAAEMARGEGAPGEVVLALEGFRQREPRPEGMARALAAAVCAAQVVLDLAGNRDELERMSAGELAGGLDDPTVAPEASRTRILYLDDSGLGLLPLLALARGSLLRVAGEVFPPEKPGAGAPPGRSAGSSQRGG